MILSLLAFTFGFSMLALIDVPFLIRRKSWYELTVYSILFLTTYILAIIKLIGINLGNPYTFLEILYQPLSRWVFSGVPTL